MTPKQGTVLAAIRSLTVGGIGPSLREISALTGFGVNSVHRMVEILTVNGDLYRTGAAHRGIRAVGQFDENALANLSHHELVAIRAAADDRLNHRRAA